MVPVRIALIGLGLMGRAHLKVLQASVDIEAVAAADPSPIASEHARAANITFYADYRAMLDREHLDGVIIASPNAEHVPMGLACIERGIAVLVEKPIADTLAGARQLVASAEA